MLGGAVEVNTLGKALADLIAALKSKEPAATSDDVGRDLSSVQALQKKNNDLARDVSALAEKAKVLNVDVDKTAAANPKTAPALLQKQAELNETLSHIQELVGNRTKKLEDAEALAAFTVQHAEAHDWLAERSAEVDAAESPKDAASSQLLLKKHDALRVRLPLPHSTTAAVAHTLVKAQCGVARRRRSRCTTNGSRRWRIRAGPSLPLATLPPKPSLPSWRS